MIPPRPAVLDACVLVPMPLADSLLRLAALGMFVPKWSSEIIAEVNRTLIDKFGLTHAQVVRREAALARHFPAARVEVPPTLVPTMSNDHGDRHVLAAAIASGAPLIVTSNVRHFPPSALGPYGVVALRPGVFLSELYDMNPQTVLASLISQAIAVRVPLRHLLRRLAVGCPEFVERFGRGSLLN